MRVPVRLLWGGLALALLLPVFAAPSRSSSSLSEAEKRRAQQLAEMRAAEAARLEMLTQEKSLLGVLDKLEREIERVRRSIAALRRQIRSLETSIGLLEREIAVLEKKRDERRDLVARRLRANYKINYLRPSGLFGMAFQADDVREFLVRLEYVRRIRVKDTAIMAEYADNEARLKKRREELVRDQRRLLEQQEALTRQERALARDRNERAATLKTIRENRALQERAIREYEAQIRALDNLIARLIRRQRAASGADGTPSTRVLGSTDKTALAARELGKIMWPVEGEIVSNISPALEGVTIRAPEGTPVRAVRAGTVEYAEWFNGLGFGKLIVLNHGNGYRSFYAHLREFAVKQGDRVREGQTIGRVGSTGSLIGPVLYFEMRHQFDVINFRRVAE